MKWLRRLLDKIADYEPNSVHVYCYQCQKSETHERTDDFTFLATVKQWEKHADDRSHTIQVLCWCSTPYLLKRRMYHTFSVEDTQYPRKGAD